MSRFTEANNFHFVEEILGVFCEIHGTFEPCLDRPFRICGECFHTFPTETQLIKDHNYVMELSGLNKAEYIEHVHCCPWCAHDW